MATTPMGAAHHSRDHSPVRVDPGEATRTRTSAQTPAALRRRTARPKSSDTVAGVKLTNTGVEWVAQGWHIAQREDSAGHWHAEHEDRPGHVIADTGRERLVRILIAHHGLVPDAKRGAA